MIASILTLTVAMAATAQAVPQTAIQIGWCAPLEKLAAAKSAGFDYLEIPIRLLAKLSEDDYQKIKSEHTRIGLPTPVGNQFVPGDIKIAGPLVDRTRQKSYLVTVLDRAAGLGVKTIVLGSGGARMVPDDFPRDKAFAQLVTFAQMAATEARKRGITIAVEPLRSEETNIFNTAADALRWIKAVNHPNFQLMVDLYHLTSEKEDPNIIVTARRHIRHFHFANPVGRTFPQKDSEFDYAPFFAALRAIHYHGTLSIEAAEKDFAVEAPVAIALLRSMAGMAKESHDGPSNCSGVRARVVPISNPPSNWRIEKPADIATCQADHKKVIQQQIDEGRWEARPFTVPGVNKPLPYRLFKPDCYDPGQKYPLVIYLHHAGAEASDVEGPDNLEQLRQGSLLAIYTSTDAQKKNPAFVVAPHATDHWDWTAHWKERTTFRREPHWPMKGVHLILEQLLREFPIDPRRVYVTGISMGGFGTWDMVSRYPNEIAAGVAYVACGDWKRANLSKSVPMWSFAASGDEIVPIAKIRQFMGALQTVNAKLTYWELPGGSHAFGTEAECYPNVADWLMSQLRSARGYRPAFGSSRTRDR